MGAYKNYVFRVLDLLGLAVNAGLLGVEAELSAKPVEIFETIKYGNQYHGFTDPTNDVYDARSAEQSHASMRHFYAARLGMPSTC